MRSRMTVLMAFLLALAVLVPLSAYAAPIDVNVTVDIQPIFDLQVVGPGLSNPLIEMAWTPTLNDFNKVANAWIEYPDGTPYLYEGGWTISGRTGTCLIKANAPWRVYLRGGSAEFTGGGWAKPVEDIIWIDGGEPYRHLTIDNVAVYSSASPPGNYDLGGGETDPDFVIPITFRILLDWAKDEPGTYSNTVIFTLGS